MTGGLRHTKPAVSAVSAALWSVTPKQASYVLILAVQQGLCRPSELAEVMERVRRHRFRRELQAVVLELARGVQSVGELDVARQMRGWGLPEPSRQKVRRRPSGIE